MSLGRARRLVRELSLVARALENWPVVALAGALWKFLPLPRRDLLVKSRGSTRLVVPLARDAGALYPVLEIFAFSAYECGWRLEDAPYVIDIGANVGAFVLWLTEAYPRLRGACYEPDPDTFSYLNRNVARYGVVTHCEAVSDRTGTAVLHRPVPFGGASSIRMREPRGTGVNVSMVAFDDIMAAIDEPVALIKMDCEGSEYDIVLGSRPESWRAVRRVVIEYHRADNVEPASLVERLAGVGFSLFRARAATPGVGTYWFIRENRLSRS